MAYLFNFNMRTANYFVSTAFMLIAARSVNGDEGNDKSMYSNNGSERYMLKLHNIYRKLHDSNPLTMDTVMSDYAEEVMVKLIKKKIIKHKNVGINTYVLNNPDSCLLVLNAGTVFMHWYGELLKYDFTKEPTDFRDTEHFTQIVWKETSTMGVAVRHNGPDTIVVVTYFPRGNIPKQFQQNVSLTA